jgi:hypothetical protein
MAASGTAGQVMSEPIRTLALVAIVSVTVFTALTSGFAALGFASTDQPKRALRWLLFALGSAVVAGAFGGLIFGAGGEC